MSSGRRTEHNPFTGKDKPWDPYGIAKVNLSDFLLGEKIIECSVPIKPCKIPDVMDGKGGGIDSDRIVGKPGSVDGPGIFLLICLLPRVACKDVLPIAIKCLQILRGIERRTTTLTQGSRPKGN